MALTVIQDNNKLVRYVREINREFCRENMFSPYMGEEMNAIIRVRNELKSGGEIINLPIVARLTGAGVTTGTLVGNEEKIDNYGQRIRVDWARHAVVTNKAEIQKDSADIFGEAKPLLSDWGKELQRDEIIAALMALPSETLPTDGRVHGIQFDLASAAQLNTWLSDNSDRVLYGASTANHVSLVHETALDTLDVAGDSLTAARLSLLKRVAMNANPKIRPFKTRNGYEYFVAFMGTNLFRDLKDNLNSLGGTAVNLHARPRETMGPNGAPDNPLFQDGDQLYDGIIARQVPEISSFVTSIWTDLLAAGSGDNVRAEPVFLCGQQAATICWGQMAKPTERAENDYQFVRGVGIDMCYGISKIWKKHPMTGTALKQWGMATGFFATTTD
jgi:hypothetical protein